MDDKERYQAEFSAWSNLQQNKKQYNRAKEHATIMGFATLMASCAVILIARINGAIEGRDYDTLLVARDALWAVLLSVSMFIMVYVMAVDWRSRIMWLIEMYAKKDINNDGFIGPDNDVVNLGSNFFLIGKTRNRLLPSDVKRETLDNIIVANIKKGRGKTGDVVLSARDLNSMDVVSLSAFGSYSKFLQQHGMIEPAGKSKNAGFKLTRIGQVTFERYIS